MHEENGKKEKNGSSWCMCVESENDTLTFLTDFLQFKLYPTVTVLRRQVHKGTTSGKQLF
jgi:hypothetical protein